VIILELEVAGAAVVMPPIAFLTGPPVMYFILVLSLNPSMLLTFLENV
jgi:hypothetical protein